MTVVQRDEARIAYAVFDTALGACGVAWSETGLLRLQLPERDHNATRARLTRGLATAVAAAPPSQIASVVVDMIRYAQGHRVDFSNLPLDLDGVPAFHHTVYDACRKIDWGKTLTYGALAAQVDAPGAARAVGQAMARNPLPIVIPCHRVLARGQRMGGFSAYGGAITKERLLALEGVHPGDGTPLLPGLLPDGP